MIGKGAQYLTAAGFGRYRITAASLGNLDLLGTLGWLRYVTKAAILAAFGQTDGKAVIKATNAYLNQLAASDRDKATALAAFINEDPMMVCSLGLQPQGVTMPIRHLYGNGSAYINIGIYSKDFDTFEMGMLVTNTSQFSNVEGCRETGSAAYSWCRFSGGLIEPWFGGSVGNTPVIANKPFVFKMLAKVGEQKGYIDDVLKFQNTASVPYIDGQVSVHYAFAMNNNPSPANYFTGYGSKVAYIKDGADVVRLIPYYDKINEKMQWLDLVSGNYAEIYGTFTEAFYLPDGTPWTPQTP